MRDGSVVTWGWDDYGGDSTPLQDVLLASLEKLVEPLIRTYLITQLTSIVLRYLY